ncbi:MAG: translation elongation factor Ts, partial [Anaeromassilibacillus sp.]
MQVAAINPSYLDEASVPADVVEHEKKILTEQVIESGKPANIAEKIVVGRLGKFFKEVCLVDQAYVKDGDLSVQQYTANTAKELGGDIKIVAFVRFEKGEGLEKREDNFADEVANMIK